MTLAGAGATADVALFAKASFIYPLATLAEGLQKALAEAITKLPIPKVMTYQLADGWTDVKIVLKAEKRA